MSPAKASTPGKRPRHTGAPGVITRRLAAELVRRIDEEGAYANLVLGPALEKEGVMSPADKRLVTELVYGTTRMRRACDWMADRFVTTEPDAVARSFLRIGAYQLAFTDIPEYAAVSATVAATPQKLRPFVNAILRQILRNDREWPDDATRLSYPDWMIAQLERELGADDALAALERMNTAPKVTTRDDGYTQDEASQWVAAAMGVQAGERILDVCAAPGGKATAMAAAGAFVVAADRRPSRAGLVRDNAASTGMAERVAVVVADGTAPAWPAGCFDGVLVDAPCSGLGVLRRRADARWRVAAKDIDELAVLQRRLVDASVPFVRPGGVFVYSVCTLTDAETLGIDRHLAELVPTWQSVGDLDAPWRAVGRGWRLLPQDADTDGMYVLRLRRPEEDR